MQNLQPVVKRREPSIPAKELDPSLCLRQFGVAAFDLDGTLLNSDHQMSDKTIEYLRYLDSCGIQILFATGRAAPTVYEHVLKLNLPLPLPVVCSNGATGLLCEPGPAEGEISVEEFFSMPVPYDITTRTIRLARKLGLVTQYYNGNDIYANPWKEHHRMLTRRYKKLTGCNTIFVKDDFDSLLESQKLSSKLLVLCLESELNDTMAAFRREFYHGKVTLVYGSTTDSRDGWFLEILHPEVCKGRGLERMCEALQCTPEDCVAFGDGHNDLEFLELAGKGIAMKNAQDEAKKVADEITNHTNNEDGVRRTLQRMEKEGLLKLR